MEVDKFSKQSRKAIVIFSIVFLIIVLFPRVYLYFQPIERVSISEKLIKSPDKVYQNKFKKFNSNKNKPHKRTVKFKNPPRQFDPNLYTIQDWMNLGLSEKQSQTIINFNKYGFYSIEDMEKCFIFQDKQLMDVISDSLIFPTRNNENKGIKDIHIELNSANKEDLIKLSGIGEYFAAKIIDYRERLGGFHSLNQLLEIYRFDKEKLEKIKPNISVRTDNIIQLNLNDVDVKTLRNHPYINSWNLANSIVKMRQQKGSYKKIEEIKESDLMTDEIFNKIQPYLKIE